MQRFRQMILHVLLAQKRSGLWDEDPTHHNEGEKGVFDMLLRVPRPILSFRLAALSAHEG